MPRIARVVGALGLGVGLGLVSPASWAGAGPDPAEVRALGRKLIDEAAPQADREAIIREHPELSGDLIAGMVDDLKAGTDEEYRRIPWIWRVAIAAGKRNEADELRRLL